MDEFLTAFFDVFFYPLASVETSFEDNPVMLIFCMVLIGMGVVGMVRRFLHAAVGVH